MTLLTWSSKERALVSFTRSEDFQHNQEAFKIIKQWADRHISLQQFRLLLSG